MIEELKNDDLVRKVGGKFKLTALIQRRWLQLLQGERPLVDAEGLTEMEIIIKEIMEDQIEAVYPESTEEDDDEG
jgi:DNA-directed RNA polymerase subunit omega